MKKITKKSAAKWFNPDAVVSLHEAVCLALGYEPEGSRPPRPSRKYLDAEKWILETVPRSLGAIDRPPGLTDKQWAMHEYLRAMGRSGPELAEGIRTFGELPESEQDIALEHVHRLVRPH